MNRKSASGGRVCGSPKRDGQEMTQIHKVHKLPETVCGCGSVYRVRYEMDTEQNRELLVSFIEKDDVENVKLLLQKGVDTSFLSSSGYTPLRLAIHRGNAALVEILLSLSYADVNQTDEMQQTPLMTAVKLPQEDSTQKVALHTIVGLLLNVPGIHVNATDMVGSSALLFAVSRMDIEITGQLLRAGADPNLKNALGKTPLHTAVINDDRPMVELLLEYGGRELKDDSGLCPIRYASPDVASYIESEPPAPKVEFISTQKYRPGSNKKQLGITSIGFSGSNHQAWLARDLRVLVQQGCNVLVTVLDTQELATMGISDLFTQLPKYGIESIHFPIQKWLPRVPLKDFFVNTSKIVDKIRENQVVVIHSDSGKGRSGLLAAAVLVEIGYSEQEAMRMINGINPHILKNPAYQVYLSTFSVKVQAKREEKILHLYSVHENNSTTTENSLDRISYNTNLSLTFI